MSDRFEDWIKINPPPDMHRPDYEDALNEWDRQRVHRLQQWRYPLLGWFGPREVWERERKVPTR